LIGLQPAYQFLGQILVLYCELLEMLPILLAKVNEATAVIAPSKLIGDLT